MGTEERKKAFAALNIPEGNKVIISLDGGGIRGILTIQLLKGLERQAGIPCYELADMVAGTSTGGIIAGLLAMGKTADEIEKLYMALVTKVFKKRAWTSDRYINPPKYDKVNYRNLLKTTVGDITLAQACKSSMLDLMITSKDISAGEETFFSCFSAADGTCYGTYKDVLLRAVMEATMSAPTYFEPFERFLDGGTTTFNNPVMASIIEAVNYSKTDKYELNKLSVFSFGTGISPQFEEPKNAGNPPGLDVMYWLTYVMEESGHDASAMVSDTIRNMISPLLGLDFRRFQISFDETSIKRLPDRDLTQIHSNEADSLWALTNKELKAIEMDDVTKFDLVRIIGEAMDAYIMGPEGNQYKGDLINAHKRDSLVSARGDVDLIRQKLSNIQWVDSEKTA